MVLVYQLANRGLSYSCAHCYWKESWKKFIRYTIKPLSTQNTFLAHSNWGLQNVPVHGSASSIWCWPESAICRNWPYWIQHFPGSGIRRVSACTYVPHREGEGLLHLTWGVRNWRARCESKVFAELGIEPEAPCRDHPLRHCFTLGGIHVWPL